MNAQQIRIDPEFSAQIPALGDDERALLEANILRDGCREPLVLWNGLLLDGHNRFAICETHGLPYATVDVDLQTREDAADWIDANQLGRRNLSPDQASLLRGRRYNRTKHQGERTDLTSPQSEGKSSTAERLAEQYGVSRATVERDGQFAQAVETLKPHIPDIEQRVMGGDVPSKQAVVEAARNPEAAEEILGRPHVANNSGNNEWYTPAPIVEAAREAMGSIDTDPASTAVANETIKAPLFYTAETNGLANAWAGNVWMNPPYAQPLVAQFAEAVSAKYDAGEIVRACVLVNNATETAWFQRMLASATAVCLLRGRVRFVDPSGAPSGAPLQGQVVIYLGEDVPRFARAFAALGPTVMVWRDTTA
jgi:hypothetical protein